MFQKPIACTEGGFALLTNENRRAIARALRRKEGRLLISRPGYQSFREMVTDAVLYLYDHPLIVKGMTDGFALSTSRGTKVVNGEPWQTGWEHDREYLLRRPSPAPDAAAALGRSLFENFSCGGGWEFNISFPAAVYFGLDFENWTILYVPRTADVEPAFRYALESVIGRINAFMPENAVAPERFEEIVAYAMSDLRTGEVLARNVRAGQEADALLM